MQQRVAYQGAPGAYSEGAARKAVPGGEPLPCEQFEVAFQALTQWLADRAVLPIENSVGGSIHTVYDLLMRCARALFALYQYVWMPVHATRPLQHWTVWRAVVVLLPRLYPLKGHFDGGIFTALRQCMNLCLRLRMQVPAAHCGRGELRGAALPAGAAEREEGRRAARDEPPAGAQPVRRLHPRHARRRAPGRAGHCRRCAGHRAPRLAVRFPSADAAQPSASSSRTAASVFSSLWQALLQGCAPARLSLYRYILHACGSHSSGTHCVSWRSVWGEGAI